MSSASVGIILRGVSSTMTDGPSTTTAPKRSLFNKPNWAAKRTSVADAETDFFDHRDSTYSGILAEKEKRRERRRAKAAAQADNRHGREPKRRRLSQAEDEDSDSGLETSDGEEEAPGGNAQSGNPVTRSTHTQKAGILSMSPAHEVKLHSPVKLPDASSQKIIDLEDDAHFLPVSLSEPQKASPTKIPVKPKSPDPESEDEDEYTLELKRKAREKARLQKLGMGAPKSLTPDPATGISPSPQPGSPLQSNSQNHPPRTSLYSSSTAPSAPKTEDEPTVRILIRTAIPDTRELIVGRKVSQNLQRVKEAWCQKQGFDATMTGKVFLTWRGNKLFNATTLTHILETLKAEKKRSRVGSIDSDDEDSDPSEGKIEVEAVTEEILTERRKLKEKEERLADTSNVDEGLSDVEAEESQPQKEPDVHVALNSPGLEQVLLKVRPSTSVSKIMVAFKKLRHVDQGKTCWLIFDGERLDPETRVSDTEIEDGDAVDVQISSPTGSSQTHAVEEVMLQRGDSDFQWFKARADLLHSPLTSEYSEMAANTVPLSAETLQSSERAEHYLSPESYTNAVLDKRAVTSELTAADDINSSGPNGLLEGHAGPSTGIVNGFPPTNHETLKLADPADPTDIVKDATGEKKIKPARIIYENYVDNTGSHLASVKPGKEYAAPLEEELEPALRDKKRANTDIVKKQDGKAVLASGRRAGAGWERSAIRWAPLNVPARRRLQTLAVLWHTISIPIFLSFFFLLCAIPLAWPLLIPYLIYTLIFSNEATSGTLSRRSDFLRRQKFWSLFASYFPAQLHRTVELEKTRKYIFGYHPHGIISHGAFAAFATEALGFSDLYPGITNTLLTLDANFRVPFYRDYALALGLASVSRESIENLLSTGGHNGAGMGRAVTIVVGGARESLDAKPHTLKLVLKSRKGFVKLAIRMGADLVPTLAFGENELYDQVNSVQHPWVHKFQMVIKKVMGFTIPLFHARGVFNYDVGLMPYRTPINIVVGRPIKVVQQGLNDGAVDPKYLDEVHGKYVEELVRLWESHKDTFAKHREDELEITA